MSDQTISKAELLAIHLYRQGKPKDYAQPKQSYFNPADKVRFQVEIDDRERGRARRDSLRGNRT
jgi:hypothetical protein